MEHDRVARCSLLVVRFRIKTSNEQLATNNEKTTIFA